MKKMYVLILFVLISFLSYGCTTPIEPVDESSDSIIDHDNSENDSEDDETPIEAEPIFTENKTLPIQKHLYELLHDTPLEHIPSTLNIYYKDDSVLPYITLESAVELYSELYTNGHFDYTVNDDMMTITHHVNYDTDLLDNAVHIVTIDMRLQTVTFSSRQFAQYEKMDDYNPTYFEFLSVDVTEYHPFTIDLSEYNYDLISDDDRHFIAVDLTNILFGTHKTFLYYNTDDIYLYPGVSFFPEVRNASLANERPSDELMQQTLQHMRLLFNHFHGVQEYGDGEDFEDFIRLFKTRFLTDYDHYKMIYANLSRLDDMHTRYIMNGSFSDYLSIAPSHSYQLAERIQKFNTAFDSVVYADFCQVGVNYTYLDDGVAKIEISNILPDTHEHVKIALEQATADNVSDLIIDLSCNTGGSLFHTIEILALLTDEPLELVLRDSADKSIKTIHYQAIDGLPSYTFKYYVLTSPMTYSAGNYLTYLMQEYLDATLIGEATSGGASAVKFVSVPSGSIFSMSSTTQLRTKNGDSLEFGLSVDYPLALLHLKDTEEILTVINDLNK